MHLKSLLELVFYQLACFKENQITCQIVFKIIGRLIHFLIGLVFFALTCWNRQTSFSSSCKVTASKLNLGPCRGQAPHSLQKEKEVRSEEKRKGAHRNVMSGALGWGFTSCPLLTQLFNNCFISVKSGTHKWKKNPQTLPENIQTLKVWDEEAGKVFHNICHKKKWFFAVFVLKPSLLNSYYPEQWAATKAPLLSIFSSASWPGTWTAFVEPGLGTWAAQTQNSLENRKFPK